MTASRPFRFGVVAPVLTDIRAWRDRVRRIADLGYSTLLMPDVPGWQPAPAPTLALAAADTGLRVGTWVYASPLRPARATAWEAHSLSVLTEGRFEMGIGTGRPDLEDDLRSLGMPILAPGERIQQVREVIEHLRSYDGDDVRTPVAMAIRGPKAQSLALEVADTVTIASTPGTSREDMVAVAHEIRSRRDIELAMHVAVVGDQVADFMTGPGTDPAELREADALIYLPDDTAAATETILRRREEIGYSYIVLDADVAEHMAPVVAALSGR